MISLSLFWPTLPPCPLFHCRGILESEYLIKLAHILSFPLVLELLICRRTHKTSLRFTPAYVSKPISLPFPPLVIEIQAYKSSLIT